MKQIIISLSILLTLSLNAQINVGDKKMPNAFSGAGDLEEEDLANFKKTTTLLVLPSKEKNRLEEYKKAIKQAWDFNTMEVITNDQVDKYKSGNYSYITLSALIIQRKDGSVGGAGGRTMATSTANYFLYCFYPKPNKKGKLKAKTMARVELYLESEANSKTIYMSNSDDDVEQAISSSDALFYNLTPGFVKLYLGVVNKHFKTAKKRLLFSEENDDSDIKKVAKDTLFIPSYVLNKNGIEDGKKINEAELMEKYPYAYKYLPADALSARILSATKPTYVLSYIDVNGQKYFAIFEAKNNKLVFSDYQAMAAFGINKSDFKDLAKEMK